MKKFSFYFITFITGICLQMLLPKFFSPFGIGPNYLLIFTIYFSLIRGSVVGETLGFFWGLSADSISVELFGAQTFLLTIAGFFSGNMSRKIDESKPFAQIIFVFLISFMYSAIFYFLHYVFTETNRGIGLKAFLFHPLLNALLAPFIYWVIRKWVQFWFPKSRLRLKL